MTEYADWLEVQLSGYYDRETDLPTTDEGDYEPAEEHPCPGCGRLEGRWGSVLGNRFHWSCRHCGAESSYELGKVRA